MRLCKLLLCLCALLALSNVAQAEGFTEDQEKSRTVPGFYGHPLLNWEEDGYKAEAGKFFLNVAGNTSLQNIDHLTDNDPDNYANTVNLLHLTVALDQIVNVKPKEGNTRVYNSGTKVGFLMSSSGDEFKVLDLKVVKLFCIYFYKGDELVATASGQNGDLDVLNLDVAGFNLSEGKTRTTQKITAVCPKAKDGSDIEFDGIGIGTGGVAADLIADIAINYAFLDDLEEVPIIKKYYPNVKASGKGMQTGAQNLINNKLDDGATTAVLNIGGAYYSVINDEPFPAGVEAGFKITTGSALQLDLGKAIQIMALTYPKKADGTYDTTAEPEERDITTQVNIVGLEVAGGGKSAVTLMTNAEEPFFGLRLKMITAVEVDLGATVVNYAYVKLPEMPMTVYPFEITMDVVPDCEYNSAEDKLGSHFDGQNDFTDKLYFSTLADAPIYIKSKFGEADSYWKKGLSIDNHGSSVDYFSMPIVRKTVASSKVTDEVTFTNEDKIIGYITIMYYDGGLIHKDEAGYYFRYATNKNPDIGKALHIEKLPDPGEDGIIKFQGVHFTETEHDDKFGFDSESTPDNFAAAFDYALYVSNKDDDEENIENAYQLSYDRVRVPARTPDFEIAGKYALDFIKEKDADNASTDLLTGCDNYLMLRVPDNFDWKTQTKEFYIYEHSKANTATQKYSFTRKADDKWVATDGKEYSVIQRNGVTKLILGTVNPSDGYKYSVTFREELTQEYEAHLNEVHGVRDYETNPEYGWYPVSTKEYDEPKFMAAPIASASYNEYNWLVHSIYYELYLNDATSAHKWFAENGTSAPGVGNGILCYNQWLTMPKQAQTLAVDADATQTVKAISFNEGSEGDCRMTGEYIADGTHKSEYLDIFSGMQRADTYEFSEKTRAYIPVVPSGFEGKVNPTYIVAESNSSKKIDNMIVTGIESVEADGNTPAEYYTLQGIRVAEPAAPGIYIVRRKDRVSKEYIR